MRHLTKLLHAGSHCRRHIASISRNLHLLTGRAPTVTWSKWSVLRCQASCHAMHDNRGTENSKKQWAAPLTLKEPEIDLDYILNPDHYQEIQTNILNRKGVGDIDLVLALWKRLCKEENPEVKQSLRREFLEAAGNVPNRSHPESPVGDEENARTVETVGTKREFSFTPRSVVELGEALGMLRASNMLFTTGHGTYYFVDKLAMLEQALVKYTVDFLTKRGFELISVPDLLDPQVIESCGFKTTGDVTQVYKLDPSRHDNLCLAGTSEMPLAGFFINEVLNKEELPKRVAAVSRCYRAEVSKLEEESGIYRVHQFTKVEMFGVTGSEAAGDQLLQELVEIEKTLFSQLGLYFRVLDMPTAELGAPAYRKYDMETWMPAKAFWGEISSASSCTEYQSRRLNIKYNTGNGKLQHCTTVNGTACAVPRTIMAICENFQQEDGSIVIPEVLRQYMDGLDKIENSQPNLGTFIKVSKKSK